MKYYSCTGCSPHTTIDHGDMGKGACLIEGCPCRAMNDGEQTNIKAKERLSYEEHVKAAEGRAEK